MVRPVFSAKRLHATFRLARVVRGAYSRAVGRQGARDERVFLEKGSLRPIDTGRLQIVILIARDCLNDIPSVSLPHSPRGQNKCPRPTLPPSRRSALPPFWGVLGALWRCGKSGAPRRRRESRGSSAWTEQPRARRGRQGGHPAGLSFPILAVGLGGAWPRTAAGACSTAIEAPFWVAILVSMLGLGAREGSNLQHVMFHAVPGLWRLHRMHHADLEFDATTGPPCVSPRGDPDLDGGSSWRSSRPWARPPWRFCLFEVILNATALFNHANIDPSAPCRPGAAPLRRDAGHAPCVSSFHRSARDQLQLRLQPSVVGPASGAPMSPAPPGGTEGNGHRHRAVPARAAISGSTGVLTPRPPCAALRAAMRSIPRTPTKEPRPNDREREASRRGIREKTGFRWRTS